MNTDLHPCPKCQTPMRTIERSGIHLETCPDCRGIFLDRGELDRLLDLEAATLVRREAPPGAMTPSRPVPDLAVAPGLRSPAERRPGSDQPGPDWDPRRRGDWDDDDDDDDRYDRRGWDRDRDGRDDRGRRRGGFLRELLEGLGD